MNTPSSPSPAGASSAAAPPPPGSAGSRVGPRLAGFAAFSRRGFIVYARWLDGISWKRFFVLSVLAMVAAAVLSDLPPFNIKWGDDRVILRSAKQPAVPLPPAASGAVTKRGLAIGGQPYEIVVDDKGVRIGPADRNNNPEAARSPSVTVDRDGVRIRRGAAASQPPAAEAAAAAAAADAAGRAADEAERAAAAAAATAASATAASATAASAAASAAAASAATTAAAVGGSGATPSVTIRLPRHADSDEIRDAVEEAASGIEEAIRNAAEAADDARPRRITQRAFRLGDHLPGFVLLLIVLSIVTKIMAAGRFKAEAQAVVATQTAESETLKRQVVEARMAAMQAQVEPHFLFNTLASIDHLIETDPPRASRMQKNLIALLRASMPSMREANAQGGGTRDLGRELAVIRPFLEILKVRMEERLRTEVRVSDGLLSAEFPPMMLQGLVENAIKHGLEPKAEGGSLTVAAEIVHGRLAVSVADSGVGFAASQQAAATAGTGIGLHNIRERLALLYGGKATLVVSDTPGGGTTATITVPYTLRGGAAAAREDKP